MADIVNVGSFPDDPSADDANVAFSKINDAFKNISVDTYVLPTATHEVLGGIKVGSGLSIESSILKVDSAPVASKLAVPVKINNVNFDGAEDITVPPVFGETDIVAIANGGTGASDAATALSNLGAASNEQINQVITELDNKVNTADTQPINRGGTGASTVEDARTNLDVYSQAEVDTAIASATPTIPDATVEAKGIVRLADSSDISNNSETVAVSPKDVNAMISGLGVPSSAPRALLAFSSKPKVGTNASSGNTITATITAHGLAVGDVINITYSYKTPFNSSSTTRTVTVVSVTNANTFVFNGSGGSGSGSGYACTLHFVIKANMNISAITDLGIGYFRIAMSTALASNNYLVFYEAYDTDNTLKHVRLNGLYTQTTTQFEIRVTDNAGALADADFIHVGVFL